MTMGCNFSCQISATRSRLPGMDVIIANIFRLQLQCSPCAVGEDWPPLPRGSQQPSGDPRSLPPTVECDSPTEDVSVLQKR